MKFLNAIALTSIFIFLLLTFYVIHVWYLPVDVVFYSALLDAGAAAAVVLILLFTVFRTRMGFSVFEITLLLTIWLLGGYAFAISIPTVLDRSLSFYILEKLQQRGGGIRQDSIDEVFKREYLPEFRLVDVRLAEQIASGTIVIENGCVLLTDRGRRLAEFSRFFRNNLLPKQRLLAGKYTDVLVDPFANSPSGPQGYECGRQR
jgi:hypothetical protein